MRKNLPPQTKIVILVKILILGLILVGVGKIWVLDSKCEPEKIGFNLEEIDANGMITLPKEGKTFLNYEFCIPRENQYLKEIQGINQNIKCHRGPRGRIGCTDEEYLCVGSANLKNFKNTLCNLSRRTFIKHIDRAFYE
jgi:hypothetical protein